MSSSCTEPELAAQEKEAREESGRCASQLSEEKNTLQLELAEVKGRLESKGKDAADIKARLDSVEKEQEAEAQDKQAKVSALEAMERAKE